MFQISCVTYHVSYVICHFFLLLVCDQLVQLMMEGCYQGGLPCLVFKNYIKQKGRNTLRHLKSSGGGGGRSRLVDGNILRLDQIGSVLYCDRPSGWRWWGSETEGHHLRLYQEDVWRDVCLGLLLDLDQDGRGTGRSPILFFAVSATIFCPYSFSFSFF